MKAPDYFEFFSQAKIMSGNKAMEQIPVELEGMAAGRPLVLTNRIVAAAGLVKKFLAAMDESALVIGALNDEVSLAASTSLARRLAALFTWKECDSIIAIGDASVMDMARAVNMTVSHNGEIKDFEGSRKIPSHLYPFVAVPTADLSGYEAGNAAVIDQREYRSDFLFPDIVCIDKRMFKKGKRETIVNAAMLALVRAIEASGEEVANPMNDAYSLLAIRAVSENLSLLAAKPNKSEALLALANASVAADIAWSNAPTGLAFSLGRALSEETGHPEGILMGIILPHTLELKLAGKGDLRDDLLFALAGFEESSAVDPVDKPAASLARIKKLITGVNRVMPSTLEGLNVPRFKMESAAKKAAAMAAIKIKADTCLDILEHAYSGESMKQGGK